MENLPVNRALLALPVILVMLLAAALAAPAFIDWNTYKEPAQTQIKALTGYDAALEGDLSLAILPLPRMYAENVKIRSPRDSSASTPFLSLERLDISLALLPLLSGNVVVSSASLIKPSGCIEILEDGTENWKTSEIEALLSKKSPADNTVPAANTQPLSLEKLTIKDGTFHYIDKGKATLVEHINADITADTLRGPFDVKGSLSLQGRTLDFTLVADALAPDAQNANLKIHLETEGTVLDYAGMTGLKAPYEIQGALGLKANSLRALTGNASLPDEPLSLEGLLTASQQSAALKDMTLTAGGQTLTGSASAVLEPLRIETSLTAAKPVNLDEFLPAGQTKNGQAFNPGTLVPVKLVLPVDFDLQADLNLPGFTYNGQSYGQTSLGLSKAAGTFKGVLALAAIPGGAKANVAGNLTYAGHPSPLTYSDPRLSLSADGLFPAFPQSLAALTGVKDAPYASAVKSASFDVKAGLEKNRLELRDSTVTLDGTPYAIGGFYEPQTGSDPRFGFTVSAVLNRDDLPKFGLDPATLPASLDKSKITVKGDGDQKSMTGSIDILAAGGTISGAGAIANPLSAPALSNLALHIKYARFSDFLKAFAPSVPQYTSFTKPLDFKADLKQDGKILSFQNMNATLAGTTMNGALNIDTGSAKPSVTGAMTWGDLVLQSAAQCCQGKEGTGKSGKWSTAPIDTAWMNAANLDLDLKASSLKYETWDLSQPVLKFTLRDGVLSLNDLSAGLYGGRAALNGALQPAPGGLAVKGKANLDNIDLEPLVGALAGTRLIKGQGRINLNADIAGSGSSQAALISTLEGSGTTTGKAIVLEGLDLNRFARALSEESKPGDSLLQIWKGTTSGGSTAFDTLDGAFTIRQGIVNFDRLDLDGPRASLKTTGHADLPGWRLKTAHMITIKDRTDVPPFTINIDGPLDNPAQTFAQGAINDYLQRKLTRKLGNVITDKVGGDLGGALGGLLGVPAQPKTQDAPAQEPAAETPPSSEAPPPAAAPTPEEALEGAVQGVLKGFLK
ncbi:MAG: AsmA family protein [Alphaproteobacteria bacterium]|nr:AsmA family protein [Alphaproteobacteria bacterium]